MLALITVFSGLRISAPASLQPAWCWTWGPYFSGHVRIPLPQTCSQTHLGPLKRIKKPSPKPHCSVQFWPGVYLNGIPMVRSLWLPPSLVVTVSGWGPAELEDTMPDMTHRISREKDVLQRPAKSFSGTFSLFWGTGKGGTICNEHPKPI